MKRILSLALFALFALCALGFGQIPPGPGGITKSQLPSLQTETFGTKLRRLARNAQDPWASPQMLMDIPWQPSVVVQKYNVRINGGRRYVVVTPGTTAASGGPTVTSGTTSDNTVLWSYFGECSATSDPVTANQITWPASTAVTLGQLLNVSNARVYAVVVAGTTGSTAPTATGNAITDGTATLTYMGPYAANQYASDFPTVYQTTNLSSGNGAYQATLTTLTHGYNPCNYGQSFGIVSANVHAQGTGYALNDTITLTGGTFTTAAVLKVTGVSSGAITSVSVQTAGSYTNAPQNFVAQGSTSGSGTGANFYVNVPSPPWCSILGATPQCANNSGVNPYLTLCSFVPSVGTELYATSSSEYTTTAPAFYVQMGGGGSLGAMYIDFHNGKGFVKYASDCLLTNASTTYTMVSMSGGRRKRTYKFEANTNIFQLGYVVVDTSSQVMRPAAPDAVRAVVISDSIVAGSSYHPFVQGNSIPLRVAKGLGWNDVFNFAQGGTGYLNRGASPGTGTDKFGYRVAEALTLNPDVWTIMGSVNDVSSNIPTTFTTGATTTVSCNQPHGLTTGQFVTFSGVTGTSAGLLNGVSLQVTVTSNNAFTIPVTTSALTNGTGSFINTATGNAPVTDAAIALYTAIRAGSTAPIFVIGSLSDNLTPYPGPEELLIKAAVTAFADPLGKTFFIPICNDAYFPWISGSYNNNPAISGVTDTSNNNVGMIISPDNTHPLDVGVDYVSNRIIDAIKALLTGIK